MKWPGCRPFNQIGFSIYCHNVSQSVLVCQNQAASPPIQNNTPDFKKMTNHCSIGLPTQPSPKSDTRVVFSVVIEVI